MSDGMTDKRSQRDEPSREGREMLLRLQQSARSRLDAAQREVDMAASALREATERRDRAIATADAIRAVVVETKDWEA